MLNNNFANYLFGSSLIHKLNPLFKVLSLIIMLITSIFISSYIDSLIIISYLILSLLYSGISLKIYLKEFKAIVPAIIFVVFINILTKSTFISFASDICRLIFITYYFLIFIHTTRISEIIYGISKILYPIRSYDKKNNISLYISLIFKFPNIYKNELDRVKYILNKREYRVISLKEKIYLAKETYVLAFNNSLKILEDMSKYSYVKLYGYGKSRTNYYLHKFSIKEGLLLGLNIIILFIVIFY